MRKQLIKYAMLCLVLLLAACGKEPEYVKVIPADVDIVATFDCQRLLDESELLNVDGNDSEKAAIESFKKNLSPGAADLFEKLVANPKEIGLDWSQKAYAFVHVDTDIAALLFPVLDAEKLKDSFITFAGSRLRGRKFTEEDGYSWASGRHFYIAIDHKACLFIAADGKEKPDFIKEKVALWLTQEKDESFASSKFHSMLKDLDGEIGVFASMNSLPENISMIVNMAYSDDMDISSIKYLSDISFKKGKVVANGKILYEDAKMREWIQKQGDACKKLDAKSLKCLPKTTPLWFGVGLNGNDVYNRLLEHPTYGKQLQSMSLPLDIEGVIRSINGDVAIAYPHGLFVDVKNDEILRICVGAVSTMGRFIGLNLNEVEKNQYELVDVNHTFSRWLNIDAQLNMGMTDDSFYLLTNSEVSTKLSKEESLESAPWASEVDENLLYLVFNFQNGKSLVDKYSDSRRKSKTVQDYFSYVAYSQKDIESNSIVLTFVDQERNVLEQLLELYFKRK